MNMGKNTVFKDIKIEISRENSNMSLIEQYKKNTAKINSVKLKEQKN